MDIESQKDALMGAIQQQYKDNVSALEANRRLSDEKISYQNEARGTYYSGIPTWERAQLAVTTGDKMNELNRNLLKTQNSLWETISNYNDRINAYNEAARSNAANSKSGKGYPTDLESYYSSEHGYQFVDKNGNPIKANTWANSLGYDSWDVIRAMAKKGDVNAQRALAGYNNANKQLTAEEKAAFNILGLSTSGYGSRN